MDNEISVEKKTSINEHKEEIESNSAEKHIEKTKKHLRTIHGFVLFSHGKEFKLYLVGIDSSVLSRRII